MKPKSKRRRAFSVLAGDGRRGLDVASLRASLRERLLNDDDPLELSEDERLFLFAELNAGELEPELLTLWGRIRDAAGEAWLKRSIRPLRDALEIPRGKGGRPRLDRAALLEQADAGASEDELRQRFGLSRRQLREHLSSARKARAEGR